MPIAIQLRRAMDTGRLVRFTRPYESGWASGYVLDVGPEFFLLASVSSEIRLNGFQAVRLRDVRELRDDPFAAFVETALKKRGERTPRKPKVGVKSLHELLLSSGTAFPLVTIHREEVDAEVCYIGHILGVSNGRVKILAIKPDATWDEAPTEYALKEITRVDFGGGYEEALQLVGGNPPTG